MKWLRWVVPFAVLVIVVMSVAQNDAHTFIAPIEQAGWILLLLLPLHGLALLPDAYAWRLLLRRKSTLTYLWWIATVREAVSRLLPVASIGGEVVGIRLACWRILDANTVTATVIVEVLVTVAVQYAFAVLGLLVLFFGSRGANAFVGAGSAIVLMLPLVLLLLMPMWRPLPSWRLFQRIETWAKRLLGDSSRFLKNVDGEGLDKAVHGVVCRRGALLQTFFLQFVSYVFYSTETYFALLWIGHPVSVGEAIVIEALSQTARHAAFMIPGGLGVQEAVTILLAQHFGVSFDVAISLSLIKRLREVAFGVLALISWQIAELRRGVWHREPRP